MLNAVISLERPKRIFPVCRGFTGKIARMSPLIAISIPYFARGISLLPSTGNLEGNNRWATNAADWLRYRLAASKHADASASLMELGEDDVARAFGHGIEVRSKSGALSIRELKA